MVRGSSKAAARVRRAAGPLVAAVLAVAWLIVVPAAAAGAIVTFPDLTRINGTTTDYVITLDDPGGAGTLLAWWEGTSGTAEVVLPHQGEVALSFDETITENARIEVWVGRCPGQTLVDDCELLHHAGVEVLVRAWAEVGTVVVGSLPRSVTWSYFPRGSGSTRWRLLAADGTLLREGTTAYAMRPTAELSVPTGTPPQQGLLQLSNDVDTDVGRLSGTQEVEVHLDGVGPGAPTVTVSDTSFYPYQDGYRDYITVQARADPGTTVKVWVDDEAGRSIPLATYWSDGDGAHTGEFWGRDGSRYLYGTHRIRVVSSDGAGNETTTLSGPILLSPQRLATKVWERTVPATRTVVDRWSGSCGALRTPASRGWRRSLAYVSGRCRPVKKSAVVAVHALRLPRIGAVRHDSVRVSLYGGPSRGALRGSYLVMGLHPVSDPDAFGERKVFKGMQVRQREGSGGPAQEYVHDLGGSRPTVLWSTGLAGGSRYDVRSFTLTYHYSVLVDPPSR